MSNVKNIKCKKGRNKKQIPMKNIHLFFLKKHTIIAFAKYYAIKERQHLISFVRMFSLGFSKSQLNVSVYNTKMYTASK